MLHLIEAATGWSHWLAGLVIVPLQSVKSEKSGPVCASLILTVHCSVALCSFFFNIVILSRKIHPGFCTQSFLFWIQFCVWHFLFNFVVFSLSITFALVRLCFHFDLVFIVFFVSYPQVFPILLCSPCLVCVSVMFSVFVQFHPWSAYFGSCVLVSVSVSVSCFILTTACLVCCAQFCFPSCSLIESVHLHLSPSSCVHLSPLSPSVPCHVVLLSPLAGWAVCLESVCLLFK